MIELGDEVKDTVTGFKGIAIARTQWLHGCTRITVKPSKLKEDGATVESESFDEPQLVVTRAKKVKVGRHDDGGPRPEPLQKSGPVRE